MKYTSQEHCKRAFTLIEMLVVVAIIGITTTVFLVDWSGNRTVQYVDSAAREMEAVIREVQNNALTGVQVSATDRPCGYRITWTGSSSDYTVTYWYKDGAGVCNQSSQLSSHTLMNGVSFESGSSFDFTLPYGTISANQSIIVSKLGEQSVVCVYMSGRVLSTSGSSCP